MTHLLTLACPLQKKTRAAPPPGARPACQTPMMNRTKSAGHQQPQAGYERIVPGSASTEESDRELRPRYRATSRARLRTHPAPVFQPTEAEFADFAQYVTQIANTAAPYGIAKIVPPSSWKGPPKVRPHTPKRSPCGSRHLASKFTPPWACAHLLAAATGQLAAPCRYHPSTGCRRSGSLLDSQHTKTSDELRAVPARRDVVRSS